MFSVCTQKYSQNKCLCSAWSSTNQVKHPPSRCLRRKKWGIISRWKAATCKHIHETPDLRLVSCHLCLWECWCMFWKIWEKEESDIKRRDERRSTQSWLWQFLIAGEEVLLWKQVYTDTFSEVQRSRILSRVIRQLAKFLVIPPLKSKHRRVTNRINLWSHRCFFSKGHNWNRRQRGLHSQRLVFQRLFSPWSCLPI